MHFPCVVQLIHAVRAVVVTLLHMGMGAFVGIPDVGEIVDARVDGILQFAVDLRLRAVVVADFVLAEDVGIIGRDGAEFFRT